jgi:hypothetical protein
MDMLTADKEESSNSVAKPKTIKLKGSKSGDPPGVVRDFGEQGWGIKCLTFSGDGAYLFAGKMDEMVAISYSEMLLPSQLGLSDW